MSNIKDLIGSCFKKDLIVAAKNTKDAHMNTVGSDYILVSANKNAHIVRRNYKEIVAELNLKNREMSSSLVYKGVILIGTYVDTLFTFAQEDFSPLFQMRTQDSILSMTVLSEAHNFVAIGQAGGNLDVLKLQGSALTSGAIVNTMMVPKAGYINAMAVSCTGDKLFLACEQGLFVLRLDETKKNPMVTKEVYLRDLLIT